MCLLVVAGAFAAFVILLSVAWARESSTSDRILPRRSRTTTYCDTADCRTIAWLFRRAIDERQSPCDNFYQYVCGRVLQQYGPRKYSTVSEVGENLTLAFHAGLYNAKPPLGNQGAFQKAASFYQSCLGRADAKDRNLAVLGQFLKKNGLHFFNDGGTFQSVRVLVRLLFVENINFLFKLQLDRSLHKGRYMFSLATSHEFDSWMRIREALMTDREHNYNEYVGNILAVSGLRMAVSLNHTVARVKALENAVINLRLANISTVRDYVLPLSQLPTFCELNRRRRKIWSNSLSAYTYGKTLGDYNIHGSNRDFYFLRSLLNISSREFRIYATWEVLRLLTNISGLYDDQESDQGSLEWHCYKETRRLFAHAVALHTFFPIVNKSRLADIKTMANDIIERIENTIERSQWLTGSSLHKTLDKLRRIGFHIGYPSGLDTAEGLEDYYRNFPDVVGPHLDAYVKTSAAAMQRLIHFVAQSKADPRKIDFETRNVNAYYLNNGEFTLFPAAILIPPMFNFGAPPEINYGSLGRVISHEFMHALDRSWTSSGRARSRSAYFSADMEQAYLSKSQCLLSSATRLPKGVRRPQSWTPEFLADHMGQSSLLEAYRRANTGPDRVIRSLEKYSSDQLFFISSCLFLCSSYSSGGHGSHPPSVDRCNVPLKQSRVFSKAFSCPPGSQMNPVKKCSFW